MKLKLKIGLISLLVIIILVVSIVFVVGDIRDNFTDIEVTDITTNNSYYEKNEYITVTFKLDKNPKYSIESIEFGSNIYKSGDFITNTDNEISIRIYSGSTEGVKIYNLKYIRYSYLGIKKKKTFNTDKLLNLFVGDISDIHYVYNVEDLRSLKKNGVNIFMTDIDLAGVSFNPIDEFSGYLNGNGYKIRNLNLSNISSCIENCGLFGKNVGYIEDVQIENIELSTDHENLNDIERIGGLVGYNTGVITRSSITGLINGVNETGGLVGVNGGIIIDSYTNVDVNGRKTAGGLVGRNSKIIINSYSEGKAENLGCGGFYTYGAGGLVGVNNGEIYKSHSTGEVSGCSGGLVGINDGPIRNSYSTGMVSGYSLSGGLVGRNLDVITNSFSTGQVNGRYYIGGLVGVNKGQLYNSYATGDVGDVYKTREYIGGLAGFNEGEIRYSFSLGEVRGTDKIGGLVGTNHGEIINSFASGDVNGGRNTGSLVGVNGSANVNPTIKKSYRYTSQVVMLGDKVTFPSDLGLKGISVAKQNDLLNKDWYKNKLNFDNDVWDLSCVEDGNYPKLKFISGQEDNKIK